MTANEYREALRPVQGDRIALIRCDDPYTRLTPGTEGTVTGTSGPLRFLNDQVQVHVRWDDGSTLSLLEGVDAYRILNPEGE